MIAETAPVMSPLTVALAEFEGPLDLLLHLIKENKIDIFNIPITLITQQYLEYMQVIKKLDLDVSGEFLVMAATLLYIKSKMLLPVEEEEDEEDEGIDPRDELVQKLLEYQSYKHAAKELGVLAEERSLTYRSRPGNSVEPPITVDCTETEFSANIYDLMQAFSRVLSSKTKHVVHEVFEESVTIEEKIYEIKEIILRCETFLFSELFAEKKTKNELIATFIAVLELVKQKSINVQQKNIFGDIVIRSLASLKGAQVHDPVVKSQGI